MPSGKNSPAKAILETVRTLVIAYGPREAARLSDLSPNTVKSWALRYDWKQADPTDANKAKLAKFHEAKAHLHPERTHSIKSPSEALESAILSHKSRSTLALGKYTAEAAEAAAKAKDKLRIARNVRDIASVHSTLYPQERQTNLLAIGILTGTVEVTDEPERETLEADAELLE